MHVNDGRRLYVCVCDAHTRTRPTLTHTPGAKVGVASTNKPELVRELTASMYGNADAATGGLAGGCSAV